MLFCPVNPHSKYDRGERRVCSTTKCPKPPLRPNMMLMPVKGGQTACYEKQVRYMCNCAKLVKGGGTSECTPDKEWTDVEPCVDLTCKSPPDIPNTTKRITKHVETHKYAYDDLFCPTSKVHYDCRECEQGGGESKCQMNRTWTKVPKCTVIPGCKHSEKFDPSFVLECCVCLLSSDEFSDFYSQELFCALSRKLKISSTWFLTQTQWNFAISRVFIFLCCSLYTTSSLDGSREAKGEVQFRRPAAHRVSEYLSRRRENYL